MANHIDMGGGLISWVVNILPTNLINVLIYEGMITDGE